MTTPEDNRLSDSAYISSGAPIAESDGLVAGYNGEVRETDVFSSQEGTVSFDIDGKEYFVREENIVYKIDL